MGLQGVRDGARIMLVRHGHHDWLTPASNRFAGRLPGVPLSATGRAQATLLGRRLASAPPDRIITSPLQRTAETAAIISELLGLRVETDDRLLESGLGAWEGMDIADVKACYPEAWQVWRTEPTRLTLPGFEPLEAIGDRMLACAGDCLAGEGSSLLVSHQDPLLALVCRLLDLPLDAMRRMDIAPASLTVCEVVGGMPVLVLLNSPTPETP